MAEGFLSPNPVQLYTGVYFTLRPLLSGRALDAYHKYCFCHTLPQFPSDCTTPLLPGVGHSDGNLHAKTTIKQQKVSKYASRVSEGCSHPGPSLVSFLRRMQSSQQASSLDLSWSRSRVRQPVEYGRGRRTFALSGPLSWNARRGPVSESKHINTLALSAFFVAL